MTPTDHPVTVLLIDDQAIVGEAVRRMLAAESDIRFHFCADPARAIPTANEVGPTVILQDLVMPDIDGLTLVKFFRANPGTREVPLIVLSSKEEPVVKAQAFAVGANDYLVKLPDKVELIARVRYHSRGYVALLERNEAFRKLAESQRLLAEEVGQAAKYVRSLLPAPLADARARIDWRFVPSTTLGGDSFGYHWLDPDHLAVYLLDVSGHGVGSSLMSVSAMNVISARTLPDTDFRNPGQVLQRLSSAFPMEKHNGLFFTIWYGVYDKGSRRLSWAGAGHPPALLFTGPDRGGASLRHRRGGPGPVRAAVRLQRRRLRDRAAGREDVDHGGIRKLPGGAAAGRGIDDRPAAGARPPPARLRRAGRRFFHGGNRVSLTAWGALLRGADC
jgi:phosphoserine phosphatase RsbU/P